MVSYGWLASFVSCVRQRPFHGCHFVCTTSISQFILWLKLWWSVTCSSGKWMSASNSSHLTLIFISIIFFWYALQTFGGRCGRWYRHICPRQFHFDASRVPKGQSYRKHRHLLRFPSMVLVFHHRPANHDGHYICTIHVRRCANPSLAKSVPRTFHFAGVGAVHTGRLQYVGPQRIPFHFAAVADVFVCHRRCLVEVESIGE